MSFASIEWLNRVRDLNEAAAALCLVCDMSGERCGQHKRACVCVAVCLQAKGLHAHQCVGSGSFWQLRWLGSGNTPSLNLFTAFHKAFLASWPVAMSSGGRCLPPCPLR
jgi:hypothetical protein